MPQAPVGAVVDKVKEAVGAIEEIVDENILDYCSLDKLVRLPKGTSAALRREVVMMQCCNGGELQWLGLRPVRTPHTLWRSQEHQSMPSGTYQPCVCAGREADQRDGKPLARRSRSSLDALRVRK